MTKFEFLGDLSRLIDDLPEEDKEHALEYYEDYFADAGPEKEQEIINDFVSPEFIAKQIRESTNRRLAEQNANTDSNITQNTVPKMSAIPVQGQPDTANTTSVPSSNPDSLSKLQNDLHSTSTASAKQPVFSRNAAAMSARAENAVSSVSASDKKATTSPNDIQNNPLLKNSRMRNSIFQTSDSDEMKKAEESRQLAEKTKINVKAINSKSKKMTKEERSEAKRIEKEKKLAENEQVNQSKQLILILLLIVTCPISITIIALILAVVLAVIAAMGIVMVTSVGSVLCAFISFVMTFVSLANGSLNNILFTLGLCSLFIALSCTLYLLSRLFFKRTLPGIYYDLLLYAKSIRQKLHKFTLK